MALALGRTPFGPTKRAKFALRNQEFTVLQCSAAEPQKKVKGQGVKTRKSIIHLSMDGGEFMRKSFSILFSAVLLLILSGQETWAQQNKVWELGTFPHGTWAVMGDINNFGLAVGQGDVRDGTTDSLAVSLFGPLAGKWIDLGTLGGTAAVGKRESFPFLT